MGNSTKRLHSIDILRGLVIVLMAIDHVRDGWAQTPFFPEDLAMTTPLWFITRWITHFCAPIFVFLAGTSVYLYLDKIKDVGKVQKLLFTRGLWLVAVELLIINPSWTISLPFSGGFAFLQVIWAIGISMIFLGMIIRLKYSIILATGVVLVFGHNLLDPITAESFGSWAPLWNFLHVGMSWVPLDSTGQAGIFVAYPLIPWIGVICLGYGFGKIMTLETELRRQRLIQIGTALVVGFILLRFSNFYGDLRPWEVQERGGVYTFLSFINTTKYPPSLLYLAMTLGPAMFALLLFEKVENKVTEILRTLGRVPFFFYILHVPLIQISSMIYSKWVYGSFSNLMMSGPDTWPATYEPSLVVLYTVWLVLTASLYLMCVPFERYKFSRGYWWLKYF